MVDDFLTSMGSRRLLWLTVAGFVATISATAWAWGRWSAEGFSGRIVEAEGHAPIEGAVVVVNWELRGLLFGRRTSLAMEEVVTDADGRFRVPGWGAVLVPLGTWVSEEQPKVYIYKEDRVPTILHNLPTYSWQADGEPGVASDPIRFKEDGRDIELAAFSIDAPDALALLSDFDGHLSFARSERTCGSKEMPKMQLAMAQTKERYEGTDAGRLLMPSIFGTTELRKILAEPCPRDDQALKWVP